MEHSAFQNFGFGSSCVVDVPVLSAIGPLYPLETATALACTGCWDYLPGLCSPVSELTQSVPRSPQVEEGKRSSERLSNSPKTAQEENGKTENKAQSCGTILLMTACLHDLSLDNCRHGTVPQPVSSCLEGFWGSGYDVPQS